MITCSRTEKTFSLGVDHCFDVKWAFYKGKWRELKPSYKDEDWYEDYRYGIANTTDMLESWLAYLPGVESWNDYGDFSITFNMKDVEEAGWSEQTLRDVLDDMATYVKMRRVIHAEEPYLYETTDAYGGSVRYYRHPAIEPLDGMLDKDYPRDLEPTG
jgi:hypothetical protein